MSQPESTADDAPAAKAPLWQGSNALLAMLGGMSLVWAVSCGFGYRALINTRKALGGIVGTGELNASLTQQAQLVLGGSILGVVLSVGAAVLLRYAMTRNREDEAKRAGQQQLAALGRMSAVLAHEIRNPLASLKGHAQLLAEQLEEGTREHRKAMRVVNEAMRLEVLTNSLLDFVRAGSIERKRVDPRQVLRRAVETVKDERITIDVSDAPNSFSLDPVRIEQLLVNLLRNALQADPEASVQVTAKVGEGGLVFTVQDDGPGLPEGGKRVFESFRTTKTRGTGLGLSVARRIVELHRGTIRAIDLPSSGALFIATIPPEND